LTLLMEWHSKVTHALAPEPVPLSRSKPSPAAVPQMPQPPTLHWACVQSRECCLLRLHMHTYLSPELTQTQSLVLTASELMRDGTHTDMCATIIVVGGLGRVCVCPAAF